MQKNIRLADIYIKIYNKQPLFMEDLAFLAKYDRECFEKTCNNLIYNIPEAKELLKPKPGQGQGKPAKAAEEEAEESIGQESQETHEETKPQISTLLDNLKKMEWQKMPIPNLDAGKVKNLLGSLYMEMLFPHNGKYRYFNLEEGNDKSVFNKKV